MNTPSPAVTLATRLDGIAPLSRPASAVAWPAILAGATVAAALSLVLLMLGSGLGLTALSPWAQPARDALPAFGMGSVLWMILMSALASALGGYLAGRLRTRWIDTQVDEVFFRDTAHGLLSWAVATLLTAVALTSAAKSLSLVDGRSVASSTPMSSLSLPTLISPQEQFAELMLQTRPAGTPAGEAAQRAEAARIFALAMQAGALTDDERRYLSESVARMTGTSAGSAEQTLTQTLREARTTAEDVAVAAAERAERVARLPLWMFLSLLVGAFCASAAAALGGAQRDRLPS